MIRAIATATAIVLAATAFSAAAPVQAQGANPPPPVFGVDYTFERVHATLDVDDAHDRGPIKLVAYIYRPVKTHDGGEVVIFPHGSLGGQAIAPGEPFLASRPVIAFLMARGHTLVVPYRRGFGESEGTFVEECAYQARKCTLAEYRAQVIESVGGALAQTKAAVDQIAMARLRPRGGKVVMWGGSRGGFLSLLYAARYPEQVRAVVAVSPGTLSISDNWPKDENAIRLDWQREMFKSAGAFAGPTLWVYAAGDTFYDPDDVGRWFFDAFIAGGGKGEFVFLTGHKLANAHVPPVDLWAEQADRLLKAIGQ